MTWTAWGCAPALWTFRLWTYGTPYFVLSAVTKFDLDCLGLCPCLVDIEIVDTRNGNESNLVTAGREACACEDPGRKVCRGQVWGDGGWG